MNEKDLKKHREIGERMAKDIIDMQPNMYTSSQHSHTPALTRVVENMREGWKVGHKLSGNYKEYIQTICSCGKIINEVEITK